VCSVRRFTLRVFREFHSTPVGHKRVIHGDESERFQEGLSHLMAISQIEAADT